MPYKDKEKQLLYSRQHYKNNKQKYLESNRIRRRALRAYVNQIKRDTPCNDCHNNYPHYVMDFDHINNKEGLIRQFVNANNRKALDIEISKCEVVCSNCHRIRTHNRMLSAGIVIIEP